MRRKQQWIPEEMDNELMKLQAKLILGGVMVKSRNQLLKSIINTKSWRQIEDELLNNKRKGGIRFDGLI